MPTATLTIPDNVKAEVQHFSWINWSEVAREEFIRQEKLLEARERVREIVSKSKFTEKDAEEMSEKVKKAMHDYLVTERLI